MKDIITSRDDMFLAKVAGRDVDITTMTPPVASSMHEKLMLELADRLDNGGGGGGSDLPEPGTAGNVLTSTGDGWESAAPQGGDTTYWVDFVYGTPITTTTTCADVAQAVAEGKTIFGRIDLGTQTLIFVCTSARADKCVFVGSANERDVYVLVLVDEQGSPNVSMAEKAFTPVGSADGQTLVWDDDSWLAVSNPNAPYIVHMTVDVIDKTVAITDGTTIQQIYQAAQANPFVFAEFQVGRSTTRAPLISFGYDESDHITETMFSGVGVAGAKGFMIDGENDGTADTWTLTFEE